MRRGTGSDGVPRAAGAGAAHARAAHADRGAASAGAATAGAAHAGAAKAGAAKAGAATDGPCRGGVAAWAELLRVSALFTVPGDALAGAAASGHGPNRGTALAAGTSLCLYEAGMALNDYADRHIDAVERPGRPLPSGRIAPARAFAASAALTASGLALASAAGRGALLTASALAATVWAYDLGLKHTALGPAAMAAARSLDLALGATATTAAARGPARATVVSAVSRAERPRPTSPGRRGRRPVPGAGVAGRGTPAFRAVQRAGTDSVLSRRCGEEAPGARLSGAAAGAKPLPVRNGEVLRTAGLLGAHTLAVTAVSRRETLGSSPAVPLAALGAVGLVASAVGGGLAGEPRPWAARVSAARPGPAHSRRPSGRAAAWLRAVPVAAYAATAARPLAHALFNPSPQLLQRAVGGGVRATIPLQAALNVRAGRPGWAVAVLALLPAAARLSRKVSPT